MAANNFYGPGFNSARLYQGQVKKLAADLPPDDKNCREKEKKKEYGDKSSGKNFLDGIVDDLFEGGVDSDKLLVAAILYMLIKEGADIRLIIALGYILM